MDQLEWEELDEKALSIIQLFLLNSVLQEVLMEKMTSYLWKRLETLYVTKSITSQKSRDAIGSHGLLSHLVHHQLEISRRFRDLIAFICYLADFLQLYSFGGFTTSSFARIRWSLANGFWETRGV
ncbi:hypothetical protein Goklo_025063 [Gossypium klotzschianum]|uniref:Uncharacterized protein n=2 Tax=Gossypium TaxID=3633 RepID=A0A7J8W5J0_9ROSI|nr:hypothetical protein [Gossypium klotzschianum]